MAIIRSGRDIVAMVGVGMTGGGGVGVWVVTGAMMAAGVNTSTELLEGLGSVGGSGMCGVGARDRIADAEEDPIRLG